MQSLVHAGLAEYALKRPDAARALWDEALAKAPHAYADRPKDLAAVRARIADPGAAPAHIGE